MPRRSKPATFFDRVIMARASPSSKLIALAAALFAVGQLFGWWRPIAQTDPLPWAGQERVSEQLKTVNEGLKETLETAKAASETAKAAQQTAQQSVLETKQARLQRMTQQHVLLQQLAEMDPSNLTFRQQARQMEIDIATLMSELGRAPLPPTQPITPSSAPASPVRAP